MTRRQNLLTGAAALFVFVDLLHFADHLRQGRPLGPGVTTPGTISLFLAIGVLVLAIRHSRVAPPLAAGLGAVVAVGVLAVHLLPPWGAYSDSYLPLHLDVVSYLSLALLSLSAAILAVAGARQLTARREPARA
ncbi:MAG: hypothetical protein NVSMB17_13630 [Candidatus Dormibacteria bacterium]